VCGRFTLTTTDGEHLGDRFGAQLPVGAGLERFNVCPTEEVLAIQSPPAQPREAKLLTWGITPKWKGGPLINARVETCFDKQPFSRLVASPKRRCLILADGFYEWMRSEDGKAPRQPFRFSLADGAPFAFAGLETFGECTILTCAPNPLVARLHDRMPVILSGPDAEAAWLTGDLGPQDVAELCGTLDERLMVSRPASPRVNKAGEEGPDLLEAPMALF
jgi:putative SOS response-associated peptidase YedK